MNILDDSLKNNVIKYIDRISASSSVISCSNQESSSPSSESLVSGSLGCEPWGLKKCSIPGWLVFDFLNFFARGEPEILLSVVRGESEIF